MRQPGDCWSTPDSACTICRSGGPNVHPSLCPTLGVAHTICPALLAPLRRAASGPGAPKSSALKGLGFPSTMSWPANKRQGDCSPSGTPGDESEGAGSPSPKRRGTGDSALSGSRLLACPFFKHNPARYQPLRACSGPGWGTISRVKYGFPRLPQVHFEKKTTDVCTKRAPVSEAQATRSLLPAMLPAI